MSISNENWKWIKDLINLLNDSVQKYSVKTLLSSPPTIIFVIWDEVFNISTKTNLSKEEQEMWKNIIWDWNNSEIEWISPSTIESNIEKERKTNIKKSLLKWLEKNGYNNIDFVGTDKKTREQLLDDMVEIINKKEKKSEVFIKNSIIEWPISQSIAKTLKVYENKQTYKTWNDLKDFIKWKDDIVSNYEVWDFKELFNLFIDDVLKNPDNFQTMWDTKFIDKESNWNWKWEQHKNPNDNINPVQWTWWEWTGYMPPIDSDPRKRIYKWWKENPIETNWTKENTETISKKDEVINYLLNFDDVWIESAILKAIDDDNGLAFENIVSAFKENNKLGKVKWGEVKENIIDDLLYIWEISDYTIIDKNFKNLDIKKIEEILDKVENVITSYNKTYNFDEVLAKMIIKWFITKEVLSKIYQKKWLDNNIYPTIKKYQKEIDKINNTI